MAKKILNLPTIEELTNKQEEIKEEEIIEDISEEDNNQLDIEDEIEDDFVEEPITEELIQEQYEEEYPEQEITQEVPQHTEYSEDEEAEALEEVVRERESKKKKPRKLKKSAIVGIVSIISVICLLIVGFFIIKKITSNEDIKPQQTHEEVKKQDFENYERLKLLKPNIVTEDNKDKEVQSTDNKSGQEIVQEYKLEYPYADVTLKEDADGQFILSYSKNNVQVLCYSQENQFVGGKTKRVEMNCETDEDLSNDKPLTYYFKESD